MHESKWMIVSDVVNFLPGVSEIEDIEEKRTYVRSQSPLPAAKQAQIFCSLFQFHAGRLPSLLSWEAQ